MRPYAEQYLELLLLARALKFGEFKTKSGRLSPYFFNTGSFNQARFISEVCDVYAQALHEHFPGQCENVFGPAYKGIPLCVGVAMKYLQRYDQNLTFTFNRKEAKDHGEGGNLIGKDFKEGDVKKVVIVEDVLTAGTSARESIALLKKYGITPAGILVGVDREEFGQGQNMARRELEDEFGLKVVSILQLTEIVDYLSTHDCIGQRWISAEMLQKIRQYRSAYATL